MIVMLDETGWLENVNDRWLKYTGVPAAHQLQSNELTHPQDRNVVSRLIDAVRSQAETSGRLRIRRADGVYCRHECRIAPFRDRPEPERLSILIATNARAADRATELAEKNRLLAMAEDMAQLGHWRIDLVTNDTFWSDQIYQTYGIAETTPPTLDAAIAAYHPDDRERVRACVEGAIVCGLPFRHESRIVRPDGTIRDVISTGQRECAADGTPIAIFGILHDVTDVREAERRRARDAVRANIATQAAEIGVWESDLVNGRLTWNSIMFALYGFDDSPFTPSYERWIALVHAGDRTRVANVLAAAAAGGPCFDAEFRVVWPSGVIRHIRARATLVRDAAGNPERMIGTNWDMTEVRLLAERLQHEKDAATHAASHDGLTGLLNRRGLQTWVESRHPVAGVLLYLDIDGFKLVNDRGSHSAGDETLCDVARIIRDALRADDACARIGGDEFVVLVCGSHDDESIASMIGRITLAVGALRPLGSSDGTRIGISIGAGRLDDAVSFTDALREADANLLQRKRERKRRALLQLS